jgi:phosphohistidine phosphatase SixA
MFRVLLCGLLVTVAVSLSGCALYGDVKSAPGTTTTLVLLRHAERLMFGTELTDEGRARAAALPAALKGTRIDAIYSPDLTRNLDTVAPLAKQLGLQVRVIETSWLTLIRYADQLVGDNPGKTVLWVGNTDNLKNIYEDVGGEGPPPIKYGNLYFVRIPDRGPPVVTRSRYGL